MNPAPSSIRQLCTLRISEAGRVSVAANVNRGGAVSATPEVITPLFVGAVVDPSVIITGIQLVGGVMTISVKGGEVETAPAVEGPWAGTGNSSGTYTNSVEAARARFYRVNHH